MSIIPKRTAPVSAAETSARDNERDHEQGAKIAAARHQVAKAELAKVFKVPAMSDDKLFAELAAQARALSDAIDARNRRLEILALEADLAPHGEKGAPLVVETRHNRRDGLTIQIIKSDRVTQLRDRLAALRALEPAKPDESAVTAALRLAGGDGFKHPLPRHEQRAAIQNEIVALEKGQRDVRIKIDERREQLSHDVARAAKPERDRLMAAYFAKLVECTNIVERIHQQQAAIAAGGYSFRPDVLANPGVRGVLTSGYLSQQDSPVSHERARLSALGVIS